MVNLSNFSPIRLFLDLKVSLDSVRYPMPKGIEGIGLNFVSGANSDPRNLEPIYEF